VWPLVLAGCLSRPGFECELVTGFSEAGETIGTGGGGAQPPVACDGFVVGLTVALTKDPDPAFNNEFIVARLVMVCATITERDDGFVAGPPIPTLVAQGLKDVQDDQTAMCPSGHALVSADAHLVTADGLFNSVTLHCAAFTPNGVSRNHTTVTLPDTGTATANAHASCADDEAISGLRGWQGGEIDQFQLTCSTPTCNTN
jgi:hypothetical protein